MNTIQLERRLFFVVQSVEFYMEHLYPLLNEFTAWKMLEDFGIGSVKQGLLLKT